MAEHNRLITFASKLLSLRESGMRIGVLIAGLFAMSVGIAAEPASGVAEPTPAFMNFFWALLASAILSFGIAIAVRLTVGLMDESIFGHILRSGVVILLALFACFTSFSLWSEFSWLIMFSSVVPLAVAYFHTKYTVFYMRRSVVPKYSGPRLCAAAALIAVDPVALWLCHFCGVSDPTWVTVIFFWLIPAITAFTLGVKCELENFEKFADDIDLFNFAGAKKMFAENANRTLISVIGASLKFCEMDDAQRVTAYVLKDADVDVKIDMGEEQLNYLVKTMLDYMVKNEHLVKHEKNGEMYYVGIGSKGYLENLEKEVERAEEEGKVEFEKRKEELSGVLSEAVNHEIRGGGEK